MEPDYCVGPGILQPLLRDAFNAGIAGDAPRAQAGRIEGALLWFLYVSTAKESLTCTQKAKDCDSAYAYYTGGRPAREGIGLAQRIREVDPYAHDRAWDGILALRCWRDLDDGEVATDTALRDRARAQYDRALLDGLAALLRDRIQRGVQTTGDEQSYHWAFVDALRPALERAALARSPADADALMAELESDADVDAALAAIDALFACP